MSNGTKTGQGVPSWAWVAFVFFVFFLGLVVYLIATPSPKKAARDGKLPPSQARIQAAHRWYLSWQKLPGEQGEESGGRFSVRLVQRDAVLVVSDPNGGYFVGNRQPDGSYSGTWKDPQGRQGFFEKLFFASDGNSAHGWSIGTKGERAYLVLQKE